MHQPMQGARRMVQSEREPEATDAIEWAMIAIHDLGTRPGATRAKVMKALKAEGFTAAEISEAARRMAGYGE